MTARFTDHILPPGLLSARPAATAVPAGALYPATDTNIIYQSDGAAWSTWRGAAAGGIQSIVAGTNITVDDTDPANPVVSAAGGGSGSVSIVGYNTAAATLEAGGKVVMKKVTVAAESVLLSVDAYVRGNSANVVAYYGGVAADSAGSPGLVLGSVSAGSLALAATNRWLSFPLDVRLAAGDYWLLVRLSNGLGSVLYDAGGTDRTYTPSGDWFHDPPLPTVTTTTRNYAIRGQLLAV